MVDDPDYNPDYDSDCYPDYNPYYNLDSNPVCKPVQSLTLILARPGSDPWHNSGGGSWTIMTPPQLLRTLSDCADSADSYDAVLITRSITSWCRRVN